MCCMPSRPAAASATTRAARSAVSRSPKAKASHRRCSRAPRSWVAVSLRSTPRTRTQVVSEPSWVPGAVTSRAKRPVARSRGGGGGAGGGHTGLAEEGGGHQEERRGERRATGLIRRGLDLRAAAARGGGDERGEPGEDARLDSADVLRPGPARGGQRRDRPREPGAVVGRDHAGADQGEKKAGLGVGFLAGWRRHGGLRGAG